jgi:CheY-like chemotaxis protein
MKTENLKGLIEVLDSDARNAMHSILGYLELVSERALDPAQRAYVESCRAAADRHCRGLEDVRLILGLIPEERHVITDFAPADLFARIAEVIGVITRRRGVGLFCKVDSGVPPVVSADVDAIGHALLRIAEGVVSAIDGGEFHLSLGALALPNGSNLIFEILAPATALPLALTRALQQDEIEFDASLSGSGVLGLSAARKLATALGGSVEAVAAGSAGTRISVTIPAGMPLGAVVLPQCGAKLLSEAQRAIHILVAEDLEDNFHLFKEYLLDQPHVVARAANGAEAVELATTGTFDLLFMDVRMPIMDGYAATRRIRELETGKDRPRLPIVVLSAEDLRTQRRQGALAGCSGYLSKPLRKQALLDAIRTYSQMESTPPVQSLSPSIH